MADGALFDCTVPVLTSRCTGPGHSYFRDLCLSKYLGFDRWAPLSPAQFSTGTGYRLIGKTVMFYICWHMKEHLGHNKGYVHVS